MADNEDSRSKTSRRQYLTASGAIASLLAGCNAEALQTTTEGGESANQNGGSVHRNGNDWVTFGEADEWGLHYNDNTREFEIVHNPFGKNSRENIRIESDENGDKGDIYIDDSLIVRNEVEVSDGSETDPSYTFANQNDTGLWRDGGGIIGISTNSTPTAKFDNGTTRVNGDITTTDESPVSVWDAENQHAPNLPAVTTTKSGDGSTATFSMPHPLNAAPRVATVTPASADAAGEFWVSDKTKEAVEITYSSAPPSGSKNLSYDLVVSL